MLSLLLNPKSLLFAAIISIILSSLSYGWYWHNQYNKAQTDQAQLQQQLATCNANQQLLAAAVQRWQTAANQYNQQLKHQETLVAKNTLASEQRINTILQMQYAQNCNQAISQGIEQSQTLQ